MDDRVINPALNHTWTVVTWPESQEFIGVPGCVLITEDHMVELLGSSAYLVPDIPYDCHFWHEQDRKAPEVGDVLYIYGRTSDMSPRPDHSGGKVTVKDVKVQKHGTLVYFYEIDVGKNWSHLRSQQEELREIFKNHPDTWAERG